MPKSGTKEAYTMKERVGTVMFHAKKQTDSGNGNSSPGGGSDAGNSTGTNNQAYRDKKTAVSETSDQGISLFSLTPEAVRKAKRMKKSAIIQLTGTAMKIAGEELVKAMGGLDAGETLTLERKDKTLPYSFTIDPKTRISKGGSLFPPVC